MKNPPILISVLGFFGLMVGFYYIFAGLRILGFNFFGVFATAPVTTGWGFWGAMWIIVGLIYFGGGLARCGRSSRGDGCSRSSCRCSP